MKLKSLHVSAWGSTIAEKISGEGDGAFGETRRRGINYLQQNTISVISSIPFKRREGHQPVLSHMALQYLYENAGLQQTCVELRSDSHPVFLSSEVFSFHFCFLCSSACLLVAPVLFPYSHCWQDFPVAVQRSTSANISLTIVAVKSLEITQTAQGICHHLHVLFCGT